ncbi:MAG: Rap1a/Tai family immunity protein [Pseudomonas sp.]
MNKWIAVALLGLAVGGSANAGPAIGLLAQCEETLLFMDRKDFEVSASPSIGLCVGTVEGVLKTLRALNHQLPKPMQTCFPPREITNGEAVRVVVKYLRETEMTETDDATLAMFAIQDAYPCE